MGIHHIALATRDIEATHDFYTRVMGFELAKVEAVAMPTGGPGWAKHLFYDTGGGGMVAFWDLHDENLSEYGTAISDGLGLPNWVNHLAFDAGSLDGLEAQKQRMLAEGEPVGEIDHGWCRSIYVNDPNGILVEFCASVREFDDDDRAEARQRLHETSLELDRAPDVTLHEPSGVGADHR